MTTALIIVHLSSFGEWITTFSVNEEKHCRVPGMAYLYAVKLTRNILKAASAVNGPVYFVIDPEWSGGGAQGERIADRLINKLKKALHPIIFEYVTTMGEDWGSLFDAMEKQIQKDGVDRAVLGGFWCKYDFKKNRPCSEYTCGCVNNVYWWLRDKLKMPAVVDPDLTQDIARRLRC